MELDSETGTFVSFLYPGNIVNQAILFSVLAGFVDLVALSYQILG
jgi:hypothetical protein